MQNRLKIDISTTTIVKIALVFFLIWFLYAIREIALLFFIVIVIVSALAPLVNKMSRYIPRVLSVIIISLLFVAIIAAIGFIIIPPIVNQLGQLAINLPLLITKVGPFYDSIRHSVLNYQTDLFNFSSQLGQLSTNIYSTTIGFIGGIVAFITILILSFYMLLEQDVIKNFFHQIIPTEHEEKVFNVIRKITSKMGNWLRGQFLLMVIVGILDGIGLVALGIPYALVLAVWGGLTEVIPYIGPWLGLIPALIIAYTVSPLKALILLIIYILIQQLEAQLLVPKIMGKILGLSPVIIILSILVGAKLMGILGVIVAVPVAAAISVVIQEWPELKKVIRNS